MNDHYDQTRSDEVMQDMRQFLTFSVSESEYGIDIMSVREIKGWTETTRLPNTPEYMRGVMNLRGLIVPIFDLRARFSKGMTDPDAKHVVIILAIHDRNIGILVDSVCDILTVQPNEIKSAPKSDSDPISQFIDGLILRDERIAILLNIGQLFGNRLPRTIPEAIAAA